MAPKDLKPPFKFDLDGIIGRLRSLPVAVKGVTITLRFIGATVKPDKVEWKVAREVEVRKRVGHFPVIVLAWQGQLEADVRRSWELESRLVSSETGRHLAPEHIERVN